MKTLLEEVWNEEETTISTYATDELSVSCLSFVCYNKAQKEANVAAGFWCTAN